MAAEADGSIIIDTEIKKGNAIDDIGSLQAALKELTAAVKELTSGLANSFTNFGSNAMGAAKQIDSISDSAKTAAGNVESLEEQMAKITVDHGFQPTYTDNPEPRFGHARGEFIDYGNSVQEFVDKYAAGIDTVKTKNVEVKQSTDQAISAVKADFEKAEKSPSMLGNTIGLLKNTVIDVVSGIKSGFGSAGSQFSSVAEKVDALKGKLDALEKQGLYFGDNEYDRTYSSLKKAESELEQYKKQLNKVDGEQKKATRSNKRLNKGLNDTKKSANGAKMSLLGMLGRSVLFSTVFRGISLITSGLKTGVDNIARYSKSTNAALSSLMSSLTMLKNSISAAFAPIFTAAAPALSKLISMLAEVNNWIAQTIAAMVGKDTYTKAIKVQEDYAASLTETQKAAKDAADQAKKTTFAFDTLIQAQGGNKTANEYKAPTPDQMFKTEQISNDAKALAENVKSTLSDLFQPIKDSWEEYGSYTTSAVKTMFESLKKLAADVGASFIKVWKDEGYGKAITDDLIITFGNFALTVSNLATQFDKAWVNADTGTSIMRHLGDIVLEITGFFREASKSIMEWAADLDFSPLLTSFDGLLVSLIPIVGKIGDLLLWLLNEILLPLSKWAIENLIPSTLDLVSGALDVLNATIDALQPLGNWLWEDLLQPLGEWTGEVIIKALEGITKQLKGFSNWIRENQELVLIATSVVAGFFAAFAFATFVSGIKSMIKILPSLIDITRFLWLNFNAVSAVLAAIVAIAVYVASAWDKMTPNQKLASTIIAIAGAMALLVAVIAAQIKDFTALLVAGSVAAAAGFALVGIAANANSSAKKAQYPSTSYSSSGYSSFSSVMPRLATGTVVPPRAGEFAAILGDNNKDYEVVSPLETMKQAFKEAIGEMGGMGGGAVNATLELDGTKFGQLVYKYNNKETNRVGTRIITNGG